MPVQQLPREFTFSNSQANTVTLVVPSPTSSSCTNEISIVIHIEITLKIILAEAYQQAP